MMRQNSGERREAEFESSQIFAVEVWEEEGGALLSADSSESDKFALSPTPGLNQQGENSSGTSAPGLRQEMSHLGYSQEELYFYKVNRDLKERLLSEKKVRPEAQGNKK